MKPRPTTAAILICGLFALSSCSLLPTEPAIQSSTKTTPSSTALSQLQSITIKGRAPKTGYSREQFGPAWKDVDRTGCDTRNRILGQSLSNPTFKPGTKQCVVLTGTLNPDPYTGKTIEFTRGPNSGVVQVDHLVALSDAWQKGAQSWTQTQRERFANDLNNLVLVEGKTNQRKSDGDLATWLPPNRQYWCTYTSNIVNVKATYGLWMTKAEYQRAQDILKTCP